MKRKKEIVDDYGLMGVSHHHAKSAHALLLLFYRQWISQERVLDHNLIYLEYI